MHQVSRRWAKRTIAAPFRACGSSAETILSGRVRDMHDVLKVLFAIAGAFAYWKLGKNLWSEFVTDVDAEKTFTARAGKILT